MARILTDETTLTRKRSALVRESDVLKKLSYAEAAGAAILLIVGIALLLIKGSMGVLILAVLLLFFAIGHIVKIRQNEVEHRHVTIGLKGEITVATHLSQALGNDTYILNDINVMHGRFRAQIDHLIISPKGIFVLETKAWRGEITGDAGDRRWRQVKNPGDEPINVSNPVVQNQRHIETLSGFLHANKVSWPDLFSVIVTTSRHAVFKVTGTDVPVLEPAGAADYIAKFEGKRRYSEAEIDAVINLFMEKA